jgi:hypothetical protein
MASVHVASGWSHQYVVPSACETGSGRKQHTRQNYLSRPSDAATESRGVAYGSLAAPEAARVWEERRKASAAMESKERTVRLEGCMAASPASTRRPTLLFVRGGEEGGEVGSVRDRR